MHEVYSVRDVGGNLIMEEKRAFKSRLIIRGGGIEVYAVGRIDYHRLWYFLRCRFPEGVYLQLRYVGVTKPRKKNVPKNQLKLL